VLAQPTLVAWRDAGWFSQLLLLLRSPLTMLWRRSFPPRGFIGQASTSFPVSGLLHNKLISIQVSRRAVIENVRLWRLTYVWGICQPRSQKLFGRWSHLSTSNAAFGGASTPTDQGKKIISTSAVE